MRRLLLIGWCALLVAACATAPRKPALEPAAWDQRLGELRKAPAWQLDGRAAVAVGTQGWQATLNWVQRADSTDVHLSGPFGIGALEIKRSADGLSLNGAPPSEAVLEQLQDKLGFELPLDHLRFWLLGVPDPGAAFELQRNDQDRASQLTQSDWNIVYDRYQPVAGDLLPSRLVLTRDSVRVRIIVDRWTWR